MSDYVEQVTRSLEDIILELSEIPMLFLRNPKSDFTRHRKIDFKTFVGITINLGGCTMGKELLDFFDFDVPPPAYLHTHNKEGKSCPKHLNICIKPLQKSIPQQEMIIMVTD